MFKTMMTKRFSKFIRKRNYKGEISALKEHIGVKKEEINELRKDIGDKQGKIEQLKGDNVVLSNIIRRHENSLNNLLTKHENLVKQNDMLKRKNTQLQNQYQSCINAMPTYQGASRRPSASAAPPPWGGAAPPPWGGAAQPSHPPRPPPQRESAASRPNTWNTLRQKITGTNRKIFNMLNPISDKGKEELLQNVTELFLSESSKNRRRLIKRLLLDVHPNKNTRPRKLTLNKNDRDLFVKFLTIFMSEF